MKESFMQKKSTIAALALISCFLWGSAVPSIKTGYRLMGIDQSDTATQFLFAGLRFTIAGLMVILIVSLLRHEPLKPSKSMWKPVFTLSIFQTVGQYTFFYIGVAHISGVKGSIITGMGNFFAILVACLMFRQEKLGMRKAIGCALGLSGVVLINVLGVSVDLGFTFLGEGCYTLAALSYAFSTVLISRFGQNNDPVTLSGYQFTIGGIVLAIIGLAMGGHIPILTPPGLLILLYLGMVSAVAYTLWSILLKYNPVSKVAIFGFSTPIMGSILSAIILNEGSHLQGAGTIISLILVCVGIFIVNMAPAEQK